MSDTRGLTYLRPPRCDETTSLPISGDRAFTAASTVYTGPLGPGTYELVVVSSAASGEVAGHFAFGPWDAVDGDVVTARGGTTAFVPTADSAPALSGERLTFTVAEADMGIALIGASGVTGTYWIRRA